MNQNEQMVQVLSRTLSAFGALSTLTQNTTAQHIIKEQIQDLNKTIDHVKKTLKTEHTEADVLNKVGNVDMMREALRRYDEFEGKNATQQLNKAERTIEVFRQALAAEPATLVRLTEEDQVKIVTFFLHCGLDNWQKLWQCSNAIMDTMVAKNGGTE